MHLCIAGSVRAMPEKEKPPAMPVDIYCCGFFCLKQNSLQKSKESVQKMKTADLKNAILRILCEFLKFGRPMLLKSQKKQGSFV